MTPFVALFLLREKCKGNEEMYRDFISDLAPKETDLKIGKLNQVPYKFSDVEIGRFNNSRIYLNIEQAKLLCNKHLVEVNTDLLNQLARLTKTNKKLYKEKQRLLKKLKGGK